jgi:hypothetical protein
MDMGKTLRFRIPTLNLGGLCHEPWPKSMIGGFCTAEIHYPVRRFGAILRPSGGAGPDERRGAMNREEERQLSAELERLKQEHRDLDAAIEAMLNLPDYDRLRVQRLKKRKLQLKDQIGRIEDQLFPDIIA